MTVNDRVVDLPTFEYVKRQRERGRRLRINVLPTKCEKQEVQKERLGARGEYEGLETQSAALRGPDGAGWSEGSDESDMECMGGDFPAACLMHHMLYHFLRSESRKAKRRLCRAPRH